MSNAITYLGKTYTDEEIVSGNISKKQSLNMGELTVDTMEITLRPNLSLGFCTRDPYPFFTRDRQRFMTREKNPFAGEFAQNTPIQQYIDSQPYSCWYLQSVERIAKNQYLLSSMSALGKLTNITHYGGVYNHVPASTVIASIIGTAVQYEVDASFQNVEISGWLPIASARDNLQQVIFALNAGLQTDFNGKLYIRNIYYDSIPTIQEGNIYSDGAAVKLNSPITKVVVVEHQYLPGTVRKTLFNGEIAGSQTVTFDEPIDESSFELTAGFAIDGHANYAVITGNGSCELTGIPYAHTNREFSADVTTANTANIIRVANATLVNVENSADVVARLVEYYKHRKHIEISAADIYEVGTVANIYDPYDGGLELACIESSQISLSAQKKSTISALVGFQPWSQQNFVTVHVIITESGTYTFPADLVDGTGVQVVMIGGGAGGSNGENGKFADQGNGSAVAQQMVEVPSYDDDDNDRPVTFSPKYGGNGGAGGTGGGGGNVYVTSIGANHSQPFTVTIGAGGNPGEAGGNTTFGNLSSEQGESLDNGYADYDPTTKVTTVYGVAGINGFDGGNGGNGGANGNGYNGGDVSTYHGGSGGVPYGSTYNGLNPNGGAGGGGAALGNNGNSAENWNVYKAKNGVWTEFHYENTGADGADAIAPSAPNPLLYGSGGNGGNGGGGGGSTGGLAGIAHVPENENRYRWIYTRTGGNGGAGSAGTAGVQGCVILTYRKPA